MESLKYLAEEIELRRCLLHEFVKDAGFLADLIKKGADRPEQYCYFENGELGIFLPPDRANADWLRTPGITEYLGGLSQSGHLTGIFDLTFGDLTRYLPDFLDPKLNSVIYMPLKPHMPFPPGYDFEELKLEFIFGPGIHQASLLTRIKAIRRQKVFQFQAMHDRIRKDYKTSEGYQIHESIRRKVGDLRNWGSRIIPPFTQINKNTSKNVIWRDLLWSAFNQGYLNEAEIYDEFKQTLPYAIRQTMPPQALNDLVLHLICHRPYPYTPKSTSAYLKMVIKGYTKKAQKADSGDLMNAWGGKKEPSDALRVVNPTGIKGSVPYVSMTSGIPEGTIYRWIRQGKISHTFNSDNVITISDDEIKKLQQFVDMKKERKDFIVEASQAGKTPSAIKKYLERNKNPTPEQVGRWLDLNL